MTENEYTIDELIDFMYNVMDDSDEEVIPFVKEVIQAIEEIQQYRAIGTIEEFKVLKEKNEPKKANKIVKAMNAFTEWGKYECPCCKNYLGNLNEYSYPNYCYKCGTEIDWQ